MYFSKLRIFAWFRQIKQMENSGRIGYRMSDSDIRTHESYSASRLFFQGLSAILNWWAITQIRATDRFIIHQHCLNGIPEDNELNKLVQNIFEIMSDHESAERQGTATSPFCLYRTTQLNIGWRADWKLGTTLVISLSITSSVFPVFAGVILKFRLPSGHRRTPSIGFSKIGNSQDLSESYFLVALEMKFLRSALISHGWMLRSSASELESARQTHR